MIFACPNCDQHLDVEGGHAGRTIHCPTCGQAVIIPDPSGTSEPAQAISETTGSRPPIHVPLQPLAPGTSTRLVKRRRGCGCANLLLFVIVLLLGGFGYAMYRFRESPQQTLDRLTNVVRGWIPKQPEPVPPEPLPEATPEPTVQADAMAWLVQHKDYWPREVILVEAVEFPAVSGGKQVGSLVVPAGTRVAVVAVSAADVEADFMGGRKHVPLAATDVRVRAEAAFGKAQLDAQAATGKKVATEVGRQQKPEPQFTREATGEEIRTGLGAMYTRQATTFRVFGPNAKAVSAVIYNEGSGQDGRTVCPLRQQGNSLWDATVPGDWQGKFYTLLLDQNDPKRAREVLDPYATNAVANSTRGRLSPLTRAVASGPQLASATDAVVYEMHVRDFTVAPNSGVTNAGLYAGWTEDGTHLPDDEKIQTALEHLTELGVTHVQLMPVQDFENDESARRYNWGYITSNFFSPEGMFASNPDDDSRVRELKALVTALHSRGIGVILDVVYNHTSGNASLMSIAPEYYYRHGPNGSLANGSACGNEVKSEAPMARRLIIDSLKYWTREYGIDGYRFDLMALIDQETMRQADRELRKINPGIILYGEAWTGGPSPLQQKTDKSAITKVPVGAFNDDFRNALKGSPDHDDPGWIQNGSNRDKLKTAMLINDWCASPGQSVNYMTCHDNLVLWDKLRNSAPNADDALRIEMMKLGYLALFTSQGVPFFHGGEEFARTKGGNNNSYEAPDSVNQVDWELKRQHHDLFTYVRDAIALRKAHPMFRLRTKPDVRSRLQFVETPDRNVLMFTVNGEGIRGETWKRACVILNASNESEARVVIPGSGEWMVALDAAGAILDRRAVTGKITVRHKSGVVLYQPR